MKPTIKELLDDYANIIYNLRVDPKYRYSTSRTLEEIVKEIEASIRRDTLIEILDEIYIADYLNKEQKEHLTRLLRIKIDKN